MTLRPYQEHDLHAIRDAYAAGYTRPLLVQPTGSGKGFLAAYIIQLAIQFDSTVKIHFWVNRRPLVHDMSKRLDKLGVDHGVIMADTKRNRPHAPCQIASIDTLRNRSHLPHADLIFIDESHFAVSDGWKRIIARYPDAQYLLMTATPIRLDGRGLAEIADTLIAGPSVTSLIADGYLVPSVVYGFEAPDLSRVDKVAGEYNQKQLAQIVESKCLVGDAVKTWQRFGPEKSVTFCVDKKDAFKTAEAYRAAGITAIDVNDETPDDERDRIWDDLDNGSLMMVTSVGVISYGWDHPIVSRVCLRRPTASLQLHLQQIGRGSRPYPGKARLLVLDHAGNHGRHGFYDEDRSWSLQGLEKKPTDKVIPVATCKVCFFTFASGPSTCPACGAVIPVKHRNIKTVEGELQELRHRQEQKQVAIENWRDRMTDEQKEAHFLMLRRQAKSKGYKVGYAFAKYAAVFKEPPQSEWMEIPI